MFNITRIELKNFDNNFFYWPHLYDIESPQVVHNIQIVEVFAFSLLVVACYGSYSVFSILMALDHVKR